MIPDERLGLVFACCHPALALEAQVPLTLRLVGGLTVPEIARALLLPEATVAQRLVRAKQQGARSRASRSRSRRRDALHDRLRAVLAVLYLVFNEGYAATARRRAGARRRSPRRRSGSPASSTRCCPTSPSRPACSR